MAEHHEDLIAARLKTKRKSTRQLAGSIRATSRTATPFESEYAVLRKYAHLLTVEIPASETGWAAAQRFREWSELNRNHSKRKSEKGGVEIRSLPEDSYSEFVGQLRAMIAEQLACDAEPRSARLDARLTAKERTVIQRAADISGRSLSDFVVHAAHQAALREIEHEVILRLSGRDSESLAAALDAEPAEPSAAFKRAVAMRNKILRQPKADKD